MKGLIRIVCGIVAVLSLLFFLYGSIKFSRLSEVSPLTSPSIKIDVPGVVVESLSVSPKDKEIVQAIVGASLVAFIVSATGFIISSRSNTEELR